MTEYDDYEDWHCDDADDDIEIDVCVACGRYFEWTERQAELAWQKYPHNKITEQQCVRCLQGHPPPHEY